MKPEYLGTLPQFHPSKGPDGQRPISLHHAIKPPCILHWSPPVRLFSKNTWMIWNPKIGVEFFDEKYGGKIYTKKNRMTKNYLEPAETSMYKCLFQLDDSKSLHRKWLSNQTSILNWLFLVPGTYYYQNDRLKPEPAGTTSTQKRFILKMQSSRHRRSKKNMLTLSFLTLKPRKGSKNIPVSFMNLTQLPQQPPQIYFLEV